MESLILVAGDSAFTRFPDMQGDVKPVSILDVKHDAICQSGILYLVEVEGKQTWLDAWWIFRGGN